MTSACDAIRWRTLQATDMESIDLAEDWDELSDDSGTRLTPKQRPFDRCETEVVSEQLYVAVSRTQKFSQPFSIQRSDRLRQLRGHANSAVAKIHLKV